MRRKLLENYAYLLTSLIARPQHEGPSCCGHGRGSAQDSQAFTRRLAARNLAFMLLRSSSEKCFFTSAQTLRSSSSM
jgi:hypothetical protein